MSESRSNVQIDTIAPDLSPSAVSNANDQLLKDYATTVAILESIGDLIFIVNPEGMIEYANQSALSLLDTELDVLNTMSIDQLIIDQPDELNEPPDTDSQHSHVVEHIKKGMLGDIEAGLLTGDQVIPVYINFSLVRDQRGYVQYIIVTAKDISQQKQLEQDLKQQQIMNISRDRLQSLGELSVGLVHEISQPLTTLRLRLELMKSQINTKSESSKKEQPYQEVMNLIDKISSTIQNMRKFACQTEESTLSLINLNDVMDIALDLVRYDFKKRNIRIDLKKNQDVPYVLANPLFIEQVLVNMLTNIRDAFDELDSRDDRNQPKEKFVCISVVAKGDQWNEIHVTDNAGGIRQEVLDKIFQPFFTTKKNGRSTGIGLSICKNIVESLGGDVSVKTQLGKGTHFRIRIPSGQNNERKQLNNLIDMIHQRS